VSAPEAGKFQLDDFASELTGPAGRQVGTALLLENDRVRIWEIRLAPGERAPFHTHATTYFFVCVDGGRARSRFPTGDYVDLDYAPGFTWFTEPSEATPDVHDLENIGETTLRFTTVELLDR
jgi:predicted metal-dependent enzyme (double-stranded beta helix superfamily)